MHSPDAWWFRQVQDGHLQYNLTPAAGMRLFAETVKVVSTELSSFCNRRCAWCSNAQYPRTERKYMPVELYTTTLRQLAGMDWRGKLVYSSGYSEPLANEDFEQRVAEARDALPHSILHTHTNGDYLDAARLGQLAQAGLSRLYVMAYNSRAQARETRDKCGLQMECLRDDPNVIEYGTRCGPMEVRIQWRNFRATGTNRGGLVPYCATEPAKRQAPCFEPFWHFVIEHTGKVVPCCQVRTDAAEHIGLHVADLAADPDIVAAYTSARSVAWRRQAIGFAGHTGICAACDWKATERFGPAHAPDAGTG